MRVLGSVRCCERACIMTGGGCAQQAASERMQAPWQRVHRKSPSTHAGYPEMLDCMLDCGDRLAAPRRVCRRGWARRAMWGPRQEPPPSPLPHTPPAPRISWLIQMYGRCFRVTSGAVEWDPVKTNKIAVAARGLGPLNAPVRLI